MKYYRVDKSIFHAVAFAIILTLGFCPAVLAASSLDVSSTGAGVFVIQGTGIENAAAMDLTITFDSSTLANPRVIQGALISGAMMVVNDKLPGAVRLGIIRVTPIQGTGVIATLTFDRKGDAAGKIVSIAVNKFTNVNGQALPIVARIANPSDSPAETPGSSPASQQTGRSQPEGTVASATGVAPPAIPGGIFTPGVVVTPEEKKEQTTAAAQTETTSTIDTTAALKEQGTASADPKGITASLETQKKKVQQYESVLEHFRKHREERTTKAFLSFFEQDDAIGFRQEPPVALTDGKTKVKIFCVVPASGGVAPDFALRGARLLSIKQDIDRTNTWVIEVQPDKGEYQASLLVSRGDVLLEYPLTLAPKVNVGGKSGAVKDEDFNRYLAGKRKDLNGDGKRDYLDDYIFTANFIAAKQK